jgi:hypothetical protein
LQFEKEITFTDRRALIIWKAIKEREKLDSAPKTSLHTLGAPILFSLIVHLVQNRGKTASLNYCAISRLGFKAQFLHIQVQTRNRGEIKDGIQNATFVQYCYCSFIYSLYF